nr:PIN domain-containing protein [Rugosimonospora africana]
MAELDRTTGDDLAGEHAALVTRIRNMGQRYHGSVEDLLTNLESMKSDARDRIVARRQQLAGTRGVLVEEWPTNSVQEIVERELARRRPFIDKENVGTIGHRDTVIWLGLLALAVTRPDDTVVFVTKDKGFLGSKGDLHSDLEADLAQHGVQASRVKAMPDLFSVINVLRTQVEADQRRATAHAAIRQALHEYNKELMALQWGWEFDLRDGGLARPDIDADLPPEMETVTVSFIESEFDVAVEPSVAENDKPLRCTYKVDISFDGVMTKSEWYGNDYSRLELWDSDLNDQYVSVEAYRVLELIAEVTYDPAVEEAHVDHIVGSHVVSDSY